MAVEDGKIRHDIELDEMIWVYIAWGGMGWNTFGSYEIYGKQHDG